MTYKSLLQLLVATAAITFSHISVAQTEALPSLRVKDTWTYRQTIEVAAKAPEVFNFRVGVISENNDGSLIAARASASSASPAWSLVGPFPTGTCVRDMMPGKNWI